MGVVGKWAHKNVPGTFGAPNPKKSQALFVRPPFPTTPLRVLIGQQQYPASRDGAGAMSPRLNNFFKPLPFFLLQLDTSSLIHHDEPPFGKGVYHENHKYLRTIWMVYYNEKYLHSTLGYIPPAVFERQHQPSHMSLLTTA